MTGLTLNEPRDLHLVLEQLAEYGTPPPGSAPIFDVGTKTFIDFFTDEVLERLVWPGGATCRFFEGPYGCGKTHLLQLLEDRASEKGMAVVRVDLSQALNLEDWRLITAFVLENITITFNGEVVRGLPTVLEWLGRNGANGRELEKVPLPHPGFKTAMIRVVRPNGLNEQARSLLADYLSGKRVSASNLRRLNVTGVNNPLSARNAEPVLKTVLGGLHSLGLRGTMLLFDENEKTFEAHNRRSRRVQLAANFTRRLIDACFTGSLTGTVAVFAVLPGFLETCAMVYPALGQRLQVVRASRYEPSWRWPVLPVEGVSTVNTPEEFLAEAIKALVSIVEGYRGNINGLGQEMAREGQRVLNANAGTGYRRALIKALASTAINSL